ncbi:hypothetical protein QYE76_051900 [Lolium multiflorum]|uniref:Glabrous enhancer-binding protein-like DBD domain-containing protein n=1 Tax=Lolium multiflorum TaxID=4521 RepID=A0AAD8SUA1_LOLMU|nr:hypothetical protein QYE76_048176 [Lolium multiflorum]KAK1663741.1 hypothetical protein QYE76_051900 [Lolium multiflorum]
MAPTPSSPQTSSHLYLLTQSQDPAEVDQPRRDDPDRDISAEPAKKRQRHEWAAGDELTILEAVLDYRRKHKKLPKRIDNVFFEELAERLEGRTRQLAQVKDKLKSLERRYFSPAAHRDASDSGHGKCLNKLSAEIWGVVLPAAAASRDHDDKGGHRPAEMAAMYPLVAQKVDALASVQPAATRLFPLLDRNEVGLIEKELEKIGWSEMGVERKLEKMLRKASKKNASKKK